MKSWRGLVDTFSNKRVEINVDLSAIELLFVGKREAEIVVGRLGDKN